MEIDEKKIKNLVLCIFVGVVSFVIISNATYEIWVSIIISSLLIGFLCNGLGLFEKFDVPLTAAIYAFISIFIAMYVFIPFGSLIASIILEWAIIAAVIAAAISLMKLYFIKQGSGEDLNVQTNVQNKLSEIATPIKDCPECGSKIRKDAKFCEKCGHEFETPENVCDNCGAEVDKDAEFCDSCGSKLN